MLEMGTSGLMSGAGKRGGARRQRSLSASTLPIGVNFTGLVTSRCKMGPFSHRMSGTAREVQNRIT